MWRMLKMIIDNLAKLAAYLASFRASVDAQFYSVVEGQRLILDRLEHIESLLTPPPMPTAPEPITAWYGISERETLGDDGMPRKLVTYRADLPPVPTTGTENFDVDRQRVTVTVDGAETDNQVLPVLATEVTFEVEALKRVQLKRSLLDTDDLESSQTASQEFVAKGNIPPTAPGDFGAITSIGERQVED